MGSTTICQLRVLIRKMGHKVMPTVRKRDAVGKLYDEIKCENCGKIGRARVLSGRVSGSAIYQKCEVV